MVLDFPAHIFGQHQLERFGAGKNEDGAGCALWNQETFQHDPGIEKQSERRGPDPLDLKAEPTLPEGMAQQKRGPERARLTNTSHDYAAKARFP